MDDFKNRLISLIHYPGITWTAILRILKMDPELTSLYHLEPNDLRQHSPYPSFDSMHIPESAHLFESIHEQVHQYKANEIEIISVFDKEYPVRLKQIYQPPWVLFAKGNLSLLEREPKLAVVGARQASQYGKNAIRFVLPRLIEKGVVTVSGLAKGIDALAHECTMNLNGNTIAVIAGGLYHLYPRENMKLALEMMKTQLVLSEYPPDTKPERWQFPARNRIISGLSFGTLIIEANQKSGSLITANYAVNEGRDVFAVPGSIFNPLSYGTNELIGQGAKLVMRAEDILEEIREF